MDTSWVVKCYQIIDILVACISFKVVEKLCETDYFDNSSVMFYSNPWEGRVGEIYIYNILSGW